MSTTPTTAPAQAPASPPPARRTLRERGGIDLQTVVTLAVLIAMIVVFSQLNDRFLTADNFKNVLMQTAPVMLVGCAVTLVMIARGLDLSVGSVAAVAAVFAASFSATRGWSLLAASIAAVALGAAFGLVNGLLIVRLKVNPIIATLGTMNIARGAAYLISASAIIVGLPSNWGDLGTTSLGPLPTPVVIALVAIAIFHLLLTRTAFGRHIYAIGGNEETARLSGVNVNRTLVVLYVLAGMTAGLAGLMMASRFGSGDPNAYVGFEFDVIVAVILGGTSLAGGEGRIAGTVLGALIVGFLSNSLNLIGVDPFWQYVAKGTVLIFAVVLDRLVRSGTVGGTLRLPRFGGRGAAGGAPAAPEAAA